MVKWISILWLSFLTAVLGELAFFILVDPQELYLLGKPVHWSPIAVYSAGFLMFWALTALTAALTAFVGKPSSEVNKSHPKSPDSSVHPMLSL